MRTDNNGYKIYPLLDGSELLYAAEDKVLYHRLSPEGMPLTVDPNSVFEDLLRVIESKTNLEQGLQEYIVVLRDSISTIQSSLAETEKLVDTPKLNLLQQRDNERIAKNKALSEARRLRKELEEAKAENEALLKDKVELWDCPSCGFAMDAVHEDGDPITGKGNGNYTCPLCELDVKDSELAEAQQTITRYKAALEEINNARGEYAGVTCRVIARGALGGLTAPQSKVREDE